ncbi:MAG: glycogen debranching protein GlgX [Verrucomicrobiales bacterium]
MNTPSHLNISRGVSYPFGATWSEDRSSLNVAVFSRHGVAVDFCIFDSDDHSIEVGRVRLPGRTGDVFHAEIQGIEPGTPYGFRVHGPWEPEAGHVFDPTKLLVDPYATHIAGRSEFHASLPSLSEEREPLRKDSGPFAPKSLVPSKDVFDWGNDQLLGTPWWDTVVYEMHVKGFSKAKREIPDELRGTYAGLAHEASIEYFKSLGVTALQLMPVHQHLDDGFLLKRGLVNYWGYNTLGFFAPEAGYASTDDPVAEFKSMVKSLHEAGLEVILDVVYNHTCEAGMDGPTVMFRGFDNAAYYKSSEKDLTHYHDVTGCGNTVDMTNPRALQLVIDSLRYWVEEMHVDGFRFDLAVTLGREPTKFKRDAAFFKTIQQDPILSRVKLIAEPWDLGWGGYQVGGFPSHWQELNGKYRDVMRRFWRGDKRVLGEAARRITGSDDLFYHNQRTPLHSVNFLTSHDGFTLRDLVSYNEKHNEANGEGNRDGDSHNTSYNHGVEGETEDEAINTIRRREVRNFLTTMIFSQGVPFITMGDERYRTQGGSNNAYCQDNPISWMDWAKNDASDELREFVERLLKIRRRHPCFRRPNFLSGRPVNGSVPDISWLRTDGTAMKMDDWNLPKYAAFGFLLNGCTLSTDDANWIFVCMNASPSELEFEFPTPTEAPVTWVCEIDTADPKRHETDFQEAVGTKVIRSSVQVWVGH